MSASKEDLFGIEKDEESEYDSEEIEEQGKGFSRSKINRAGSDDESEVESEAESSDEDEDEKNAVESDASGQEALGGADEDSEAEGDEDQDDEEEEKDERFAAFDESPEPTKKSGKKKVKPLTPEELEKFQKDINKTGVVYLARIPPFMKPVKIKQLLSRYAEIGRVYLAPEDAKISARRRKYAKNNKQNFTEGWVEFKDKKKAKAVAAMLNTQQIGECSCVINISTRNSNQHFTFFFQAARKRAITTMIFGTSNTFQSSSGTT
jgi:ESF2/ABP1 family protein